MTARKERAMPSETLLPCPFCGGEAQSYDDEVMANCWWVECYQCQARLSHEDEAQAIAAWNRRAAHQERDADARRLDTLTTRGWALLPPDRNNATWAVQDGEMNTLGTGESARAAIDAAMAPDTQTEGESDGPV